MIDELRNERGEETVVSPVDAYRYAAVLVSHTYRGFSIYFSFCRCHQWNRCTGL